MQRRRFLQLLGLFSGTTLLSSCGSEREQKKLISYLVPPEEGVIPGEARWHVSTCTECPAGCGLKVREREGRPVKLEGNPGHPVNGGTLCIRGQASLWRLYHPERFRTPLMRSAEGELVEIGWAEALNRISAGLSEAREDGRSNVYLSGRTTGTLDELIATFGKNLQIERTPEFELLCHAAIREANGMVFGQPEVPHYRVADSDFLLTLGADLLETFVSPVDFARQVSAREGEGWWHLETHYSLTGANAERRIALAPGGETALLLYLLSDKKIRAKMEGVPTSVSESLPSMGEQEAVMRTGLEKTDLKAIRDGLQRAKRPLLIAGGTATARERGLETALLAALLQRGLGMDGSTVDFSRAENYRTVGSFSDLHRLAERLKGEEIGVLFVSRANPLYQAPDAMGFPEAFGKASLRVFLGELPDETSAACDLILPLSDSLESWGDREPRQGVRSILKPVIDPLYETRSEAAILLDLLRRAGGDFPGDDREYLFSRWQERYSQEEMERLAAEGYLEHPLDVPQLSFDEGAVGQILAELKPTKAEKGPNLQIVPSLRRFDGRSRPIPLLGEIPDPLTTVSYGSWVSLSEADAEKKNLRDRDSVRLTVGGWHSELALKTQPNLPAGVLAVHRDVLEGAPYGWDRRTGEAVLLLPDPRLERLGPRTPLPVLAGSTSQQGRGITPDPDHHEKVKEKKKKEARASLYPEHEHPRFQWAMAIDLERCIGCSACAAACYIENNVPVVGAKEHLKGREMSWLRIEPFYDEQGGVEFVPMLCQHCHYAPCEPVCPVYAAYHNPEGLNIQVYNRCVGTRYCSNNCPYKVRRFNWWPYERPKPLELMTNPDVSVRRRGMMEKCTFCIQRIRAAQDRAKDEGREVRDGEVVTACAQTCPTEAIVFGNLKDPESRIARLAESDRRFRIFEKLGTESSITYLRAGGALEKVEEHG